MGKKYKKISKELKMFLENYRSSNVYDVTDEWNLKKIEELFFEIQSLKDFIDEHGSTYEIIDRYGHKKVLTQPAFINRMKLENLFKDIYKQLEKKLTKSKENEPKIDENDPFINMVKDLNRFK